MKISFEKRTSFRFSYSERIESHMVVPREGCAAVAVKELLVLIRYKCFTSYT